jgi:hypothetical protein
MTNQPLTEDKLLWLDDETDMVFYGKANQGSEYECNVIDIDDVRSAVEGLSSGKLSNWKRTPDAAFQTCDSCEKYVGKGPWVWFNQDGSTDYGFQMCFNCWVDKWFPVFAEDTDERGAL